MEREELEELKVIKKLLVLALYRSGASTEAFFV